VDHDPIASLERSDNGSDDSRDLLAFTVGTPRRATMHKVLQLLGREKGERRGVIVTWMERHKPSEALLRYLTPWEASSRVLHAGKRCGAVEHPVELIGY